MLLLVAPRPDAAEEFVDLATRVVARHRLHHRCASVRSPRHEDIERRFGQARESLHVRVPVALAEEDDLPTTAVHPDRVADEEESAPSGGSTSHGAALPTDTPGTYEL